MTILGVVFDLGHTLMHLDGTWPEMFEQGVADLAAFLADQGLEVDGEAFARALLARRSEGFVRAKETRREVTAEESMCWTFARFGLADPTPALVEGAIDAFFAYEEAHWYADPEALPLLHGLAEQGLRLGLYSNATDDRFIQRLVDDLGLRPWLDPTLSSAGTGIRKPDPSAFALMLEAWGLAPGSVLMVGDNLEADILGAKLAGMRCVWFPSRKDARQEGEGASSEDLEPDAIIDRLALLPGVLSTL